MATDRIYKERVLAVLVHIQEHLDEDLSLDELGRVAHFSPFHFHRIFRGLVGESVMEHVRRLRLERAALRLLHTELPVLNLALEAGYETHESFTRAFGAMFHQAPSEYRRRRPALAWPPAPSGIHWRASRPLDDFDPLDTGDLKMEVRTKDVSTMRVLFTRETGPYQKTAGVAWARLCSWAGPRGLLRPDTVFLGLCHDDPAVTPPERIRYDAAVTVGPEVRAEGDFGIQEIPAGRYAVTLHAGPYELLHKTWNAFCGEWLPHSGYALRNAPSFEIYLNNPQNTPPEQLRTDLYLPIEPQR